VNQASMTSPSMAGLSLDAPRTALDPLALLFGRWRLLVAAPIVGAAIAVGASYLVTPVYTARTVFVPPQQQQSTAASALASLGALSGLAGSMGSFKSTADQYVSLLQSVNITDRLIDQFKLQEVYDVQRRIDARRKLEKHIGRTGNLPNLERVRIDTSRISAAVQRSVYVGGRKPVHQVGEGSRRSGAKSRANQRNRHRNFLEFIENFHCVFDFWIV